MCPQVLTERRIDQLYKLAIASEGQNDVGGDIWEIKNISGHILCSYETGADHSCAEHSHMLGRDKLLLVRIRMMP